jgi:hypothetical protein
MEPTAWPVALNFVAYRTSLNKAPNPGPLKPASEFKDFASKYRQEFAKAGISPEITEGLLSALSFSVLWVKKSEGADAGDIPDNVSFFGCCGEDVQVPKWIVITAPDGFHLDQFYGRNIIFRSTRLVYKGGPTNLTGVFFVDCYLDPVSLPNLPNTRSFASTVLTMNPVSTEFVTR